MSKRERRIGYIVIIGLLWLVVAMGKCSAQTHKVDSTIRSVLVKHKVPPFQQKLLIAQAKFESGNYTNKLFVKHNNLYGMMHPRKRPTKSLHGGARAEGKKGYAAFNSTEDSVEDMLLYLKSRNAPRFKTSSDYVSFLKKNKFFTASESHYLNGLKQYLD